jgi:hypothetical protein
MIYLRVPRTQVQTQTSEWFASPLGVATAVGNAGDPWDLQTALNGGYPANTVQPGDTIWLRGGTYAGQFTSSLEGTLDSPILVKQYGYGTGAREQVTLDGYNAGNYLPALTFFDSYASYYGLETICSNITRTTAVAGSVPPNGCNNGIALDATANNLKIINFTVHDTAQGPFFTRAATNIEIYGLLAYFNGWDGPDRGHGHALYIQNTSAGGKFFRNAICHNSFDMGVQEWGSDPISNITVDGATIFDSGRISSFGTQANWSPGAGGAGGGSNYLFNDGVSYSSTDIYDNLTYTATMTNWTQTNGYWMNLQSFTAANLGAPIVSDGNTFLYDAGQSAYGTNTYLGARPGSGKHIIVRPNTYETGRGNITVFNWDHSSTVSVDVSGVGLQNGDSYEVRHSMDPFGAAVLSDTYGGVNITIPMTGLPIATPINVAAPAGPFPEFAAFTIWKV